MIKSNFVGFFSFVLSHCSFHYSVFPKIAFSQKYIISPHLIHFDKELELQKDSNFLFYFLYHVHSHNTPHGSLPSD